MIIDTIKDAILQNIGPLKQAPKNWHKRNCPLCHTQGHGHDVRHRFGIQFNANSIAMNCFNCGFSSGYSEDKALSKSFKFFLRQIGIDDKLIKQIDFEIFQRNNNIQSIREGGENESAISKEHKFKGLFHKWKTIPLPDDSLSITEWLSADLQDENFYNVVNYAISRKIFDLDNFYWTPQTQFNLNQRLIIPYYFKGKIVGFTSRLCYDTDGKSIPKYYQERPLDFVYNLDHQEIWMRKYVIVNEGVLDAWTTDGISTLGEIGQAQIDIINRLQKEIIVCPDRDMKGHDLVKAALDNNWAVSFPKWAIGIKDASKAAEKYGRLLTVHSIIDSAIKDKIKIQVTWDTAQNARNKQKR